MFITTRGLVLREVRYKESDKILTVLTQHEGKVTVRARGALRKGSRITAATQLLTYSDMTIFENRGRRTLNEASTVEEFLGLRADLGAFALGSYFAELLETVSAEEYPDPPVLQLGLNSLYALSRALCPPEQIKAVFELRLMCLSGYEPDLSCCAQCGAAVPAEPWFSPRGGAVYCARCRGTSSSAVTPLLPETLRQGTEFTRLLSEYGVKRCVYGHLHGQSVQRGFSGNYRGVRYDLVSCDALGFALKDVSLESAEG